jgi:hypothetical protein
VLAVLFVTIRRNRMSGMCFYHEIDGSAISSGSEQCGPFSAACPHLKMCACLFASTVL